MTAMVTLTVYRTDECDFENGQMIAPRGDHVDRIAPSNIAAEHLIRAGHPYGEHIRVNCVYVWENLETAEMNWKAQKERHLYELTIDEGDILHRADLNFYSMVAVAAQGGLPTEDPVQRYWSGEIKSTRVELLVRQATVTKKLKDKSDPRPSLLLRRDEAEETDEEFLNRLNQGTE